jgi:hypothetical protein
MSGSPYNSAKKICGNLFSSTFSTSKTTYLIATIKETESQLLFHIKVVDSAL